MMVAGVLACLAACNKEQYTGDDPVRCGDMHAYIVAPTETRTDFDSYVGKFAWSEGDEIAIHLTDGTFYSTEVNAETGAFACSTTPSKKRDAYAVYPAAAADASNYGSPTLNVVLPAEYDISANLSSDYSPVPMIAVNKQAEDDLYFRHVGGLLRITCDRVPVGTQKIAVTLPRNIAGTFAVTNPASENPTISNGGSTQTVTFTISETALTERTDGIVLNLPVPVGKVPTLKVAALNASGAEIYSDTRDVDINIARYAGKKFIYSLTEVLSDSMQLVVTVAGNEDGRKYVIPFRPSQVFPADLNINWGDGFVTSVDAGTRVAEATSSALTHTYEVAGDYTITITALLDDTNEEAMIPFPYFYQDTKLRAVPTPLLRFIGTSTQYMFSGCWRLTSIPEDLFSKNPQIVHMDETFPGCCFTHIPENLFASNPEIQSFNGTFNRCLYLEGDIPAGLFAHNPKAEDFADVFSQCGFTGSIPEDLFAHNPLATDFLRAFYRCEKLKGPLPAGLFAHNPLATRFEQTFDMCYELSGPIPAGLFASNSAATSFVCVFEACQNLTGLPSGLFANCPSVTSFERSFYGCTGLSGMIPEDMFANCSEVTDFNCVFSHCSGLTGSIPAALFADCPKVTTFQAAFADCSGLTGNIPSGFFSKHLKATNFSYVFRDCSSLSAVEEIFTGATSTPADRFASCTQKVKFDYCFSGIGGGTAPPLWSYTYGAGVQSTSCFAGSSSLSNWSSVPSDWQ